MGNKTVKAKATVKPKIKVGSTKKGNSGGFFTAKVVLIMKKASGENAQPSQQPKKNTNKK